MRNHWPTITAALIGLTLTAGSLAWGANQKPPTPAANTQLHKVKPNGVTELTVHWPARGRIHASSLTITACAPGGQCRHPQRVRVTAMTSSIQGPHR